MAEKLQLDIVTPQHSAFSGTVDQVRVPGWLGEFEILPSHDLFLSLVRGGVLTVVQGNETHQFLVGRGFAEAGPEQVTVLTDSCVSPSEVDLASAAANLEAAERTLAESAADTAAWVGAEESAELARARMIAG